MSATLMNLARGKVQGGSVLIEQALTVLVMVSVMFGAIDFGRALYTYHYVSYIARDATRWASVRSTSLNGGPIAPGDVQTYVSNVSGMGLDPASITSTTNWIAPPNGTPLCPSAASNPANQKPGCIVQVTVNYSYHFFLPFLAGRTFTMSSESQMIITQ